MEKVNILGVNLAKLSKLDCLKTIESFLAGDEARLAVTPNAEFILRAQHDEEFFYILNHADLSVLDGSGPQFASWATGNFIRRYPGADLVVDLLALAERQKQKVLILNWEGGLSTKADVETVLKDKFPALDFEVLDIDREGTKLDLIEINDFKPSVIVATLGAPFQEKLLYHNLKTIPSLRLSIGVGGALDFLAGKVKRAPKLMRLLGIEWLWRMLQKPANDNKKIIYKRYARIWNATFVFVYKFLRWHFILPLLYRPNVACWLYKKVGDDYFVLMVERTDIPGHWQIPQGGTDGEDPVAAGVRELREELGVTEIRVRKLFLNAWTYKFQKMPKANIHKFSGYKGQRQSLLVAEYLGATDDFKICFWDHVDWKWVNVNDLIATAHERRQDGYRKFLELFNELRNNYEV
jgi:N-acetylglucosaminyldiphosphoundecaprenol N-acetyl-beta-D-mannosaminyltransferase